MIGQKFNMLTVIEASGKKWKYLCNCGIEKYIDKYSVKRGKVKSCGCFNKSKQRHNGTNDSNKLRILNSYKNNALKRKLSWDLLDKEFYAFVEGICFYCDGVGGNKCSKKDSKAPTYEYTGIDRMNNSLGYTIDNSISCCKICNRAKNNMTEKDFSEWLDRVAKRRISYHRTMLALKAHHESAP